MLATKLVFRYNTLKSFAILSNLAFTLTMGEVDTLLETLLCGWCKQPNLKRAGVQDEGFMRIALNRAELGYIPNNAFPLCYTCYLKRKEPYKIAEVKKASSVRRDRAVAWAKTQTE